MFSRFFINRPIFAIVLALFMLLAGMITIRSLPVAQYPDITPPTVMVSATYPGADAQTVASTIGVPIEEQVNGVENMMYMSSSSGSDGSYMLTVTFEAGTDLDMATVKVQNRVSRAEPSLPASVKQQGIEVTSRSSDIIMFIALESDDPQRYDALYLTNYAKLNLVDELSRLDGVGQVGAFGAGDYSMRVWLNPDLMRQRDITVADVRTAIESQNMQVSAGDAGAEPQNSATPFQFTLTSQGRLTSAKEFGNIILRTSPDGGILRLRDIARVELGSDSYGNISRVSGKHAGVLGIYQLPGANALEVANRVTAKLNELQQYFPDGIKYRIIENTTDFVVESIDDLLVTFVETTLIVMLVILLFLQNWRAVIIPMITIPVSLIATFAVMKLLGFTINTLTLFGLVLAIAIVVDDAIVVVEDCARIVDKKLMSPREAARKAMTELQGPVVGEVLVLLSVFIPTAFISGITGELYKQFALTIAVSTAFSGFNALTFTPAMCALFLKPRTGTTRFKPYQWFNKGYSATLNGYIKIVGTFLKRPWVAIAVYFIITGAAFWGFMKMPTSYIPQEDMGYFMGSVQLPPEASLERTEAVINSATDSLLAIPGVENVISISGFSFLGGGNSSNLGALIVTLEPWSERKAKNLNVDNIIDRFERACSGIQEGIIFGINPPAIPGLGLSSGLQMQLLNIGSRGSDDMKQAITQITDAAHKDPRISSVTTLYEGNVPQYSIDIDRDKVHMLELTMENIYSSLGAFTSSDYVNDFNEFGRVYQVLLSGEAMARSTPDDVLRLSVRNSNGKMVPFASFASIKQVSGEPSVNRYNMYQTASLTATPAKGLSSSDAIKAMEEIVSDTVGSNYGYAWTGEAYQETQGGTTVTIVILFAVIVTLLVLAAQYESLTDPVAVIISMPTAILGTVIGCLFMGQSISIYTQIGIILLLGLSAKNAILIIEYARDFRKSGQPISQAALDAGRIRFRPIMMTAMAFVFGVLPMLFASGAGAESRISLGTAVVFGMAVNAIVGTLFVPNFWELLQRFWERHLSNFFNPATPTDKSDNTDL